MTVRSLDLLDLPSLPRFRREVLPLDSARMLTSGDPLGAHHLTGREVASTHVGKVGHGCRLLPLHS